MHEVGGGRGSIIFQSLNLEFTSQWEPNIGSDMYIRVQCISGAYFVQNNNRKWIFLQTLNCHKELLTPVLSRVPCFMLKIPKIHLTRENGAVRVVIKCYQAPICFLLSLPGLSQTDSPQWKSLVICLQKAKIPSKGMREKETCSDIQT